MVCSPRGVVVGAIGIILVVLAAASIPLLKWIIHKEVVKKVIIANNTDSELYPIWAEPSILPDLYLQIYPFHVKNPDEVVKGAKAILEQRGPYTYREFRRKENIVFNDNGTVSYIERKWYKFLRNMSVGYDNETFTTINIPIVVLANAMHYDGGIYQEIISRLIKGFTDEKLFVTRTVEEIVFGYTDKLLSFGKSIAPWIFTTDKVGVLVGKNYSYDGEFTIFTGEDDITKMGIIDKFNGSSYLNFWTTKYANMINGSADGSVFPPFLPDDFVVNFFSMDICRSATAVYYKDTFFTKHNVKVRRFRAPKEELEKPSLNPDNAGFCTPAGNCLGSGVLNISTCQKIDGFHIPVLISFPHFYMAEDQYVNGVIGMEPKSEYATEVVIEPTTGLVMQAVKKIQMNFYLERSDSFTQLATVNTTVFPVLWVNESVTIDDGHASRIKKELLVPQAVAQILQYTVIGVGLLLFLIGTYLVSRSGAAAAVVKVDGSDSGQIQCAGTSSLPVSIASVTPSSLANEDGDAQPKSEGSDLTESAGSRGQPEGTNNDSKTAGDAVASAPTDSGEESDTHITNDTAQLLDQDI